LAQSISAAQPGSGARATRSISAPRWNGRLQMTTIFFWRASGRILLDFAVQGVVRDLHEVDRLQLKIFSISSCRRPSDVVTPT
jgi:hypothetical protein